MKKALCLLVLLLGGCAKLEPRFDPKIDNQNGKIDEIKNNQNGVLLELGKLKQSAEIANSQLKEVQSGLLNLNAAVSKNDNSGVQILQGDGALMLIFATIVVGMLLFHYREKAKKMQQTAEIFAQELTSLNSQSAENNVLRAASFTSSEDEVFKILRKKLMDKKRN